MTAPEILAIETPALGDRSYVLARGPVAAVGDVRSYRSAVDDEWAAAARHDALSPAAG